MPVAFKIKSQGERQWRVLNRLNLAIMGRGARLDAEGGVVMLTADIEDGAHIRVELTPDNFGDVAQLMLDADPSAAYKAFGAALTIGPRRPIYDEDGQEVG